MFCILLQLAKIKEINLSKHVSGLYIWQVIVSEQMSVVLAIKITPRDISSLGLVRLTKILVLKLVDKQ